MATRFDSAAFAAKVASVQRLRAAASEKTAADPNCSPVVARLRELAAAGGLASEDAASYATKHGAAQEQLVSAATEGLLILRRRLAPT